MGLQDRAIRMTVARDTPCRRDSSLIDAPAARLAMGWHAIRQARLLDMSVPQAPRDLLAPLFDPQLVRMTNTQMTLHGYQIRAEDGTAVHYAQS